MKRSMLRLLDRPVRSPDAMADAFETSELLDVDLELVAQLIALVATHRLGGSISFNRDMLKVLVIQTANNLSDERTEFLINDRLSFMRFLGLGLSDRVPDARTIWLFREKLTKAEAIKALFERFDAMLRDTGYIAMSG